MVKKMTRQEEIKKGLFDILNSCPVEDCQSTDANNCIKCDLYRVLKYLDGEGVMLADTTIKKGMLSCLLLKGIVDNVVIVAPLIEKETDKQDV